VNAVLQSVCRRSQGDETQIKEKLETPHLVTYEMEARKSSSKMGNDFRPAETFLEAGQLCSGELTPGQKSLPLRNNSSSSCD
jgi:hypothetical protein